MKIRTQLPTSRIMVAQETGFPVSIVTNTRYGDLDCAVHIDIFNCLSDIVL
jgi:hypothetical protein